jgi:very-short-patch-repair endonuclease
MPDAEVILWSQLQRKQLGGYKFRRQYGIGQYSVDFYCPKLKLAIEVDGESHFTEGARERDRERQLFIEQFDIEVLRFTNDDIRSSLDSVLMIIESTATARKRRLGLG